LALSGAHFTRASGCFGKARRARGIVGLDSSKSPRVISGLLLRLEADPSPALRAPSPRSAGRGGRNGRARNAGGARRRGKAHASPRPPRPPEEHKGPRERSDVDEAPRTIARSVWSCLAPLLVLVFSGPLSAAAGG